MCLTVKSAKETHLQERQHRGLRPRVPNTDYPFPLHAVKCLKPCAHMHVASPGIFFWARPELCHRFLQNALCIAVWQAGTGRRRSSAYEERGAQEKGKQYLLCHEGDGGSCGSQTICEL